jgi:hypothetical protein
MLGTQDLVESRIGIAIEGGQHQKRHFCKAVWNGSIAQALERGYLILERIFHTVLEVHHLFT